ncbi:hypothetical protein ACFLT1_06520 [Bacteroidota bacterium]
MEDFRIYDPGEVLDTFSGRIRQLTYANKALIVIAISAIIVAGYFANRCYVAKDEAS